MTNDPKYVATPDVAKHFGIAVSTVSAMVRSGEIPQGSWIKIGRIYRFDLEKIEAELLRRSKADADNGQLEFDFNNQTQT